MSVPGGVTEKVGCGAQHLSPLEKGTLCTSQGLWRSKQNLTRMYIFIFNVTSDTAEEALCVRTGFCAGAQGVEGGALVRQSVFPLPLCWYISGCFQKQQGWRWCSLAYLCSLPEGMLKRFASMLFITTSCVPLLFKYLFRNWAARKQSFVFFNSLSPVLY